MATYERLCSYASQHDAAQQPAASDPAGMRRIEGVLAAGMRDNDWPVARAGGQLSSGPLATGECAHGRARSAEMGMRMSKWLKIAFFTALLIGAGYFFGAICRQFGWAYGLILTPSRELLTLLLRFLLAVGVLLMSAGLVATLLRPLWLGFVAFALSGLAMFLGWQMTVASSILTLVYLLAACLSTVQVDRELSERIKFSVRSIDAGQGMLLIALILVACGSLYLGYAAHIDREGFSMPEYYTEVLMEQMERQVETRVPVEERGEAIAEFRREFRRAVDEFSQHTVKPYERFVPLGVAAGMFMSLVTLTHLLAWVPTTVLSLVFPLLRALGVTKVVCDTQEVQRLVIV